MSYAPDPGGNFASDAHRRTLAHLDRDNGYTVEALTERMRPDESTDLDEAAVEDILADLEADGDATQAKGGEWKMTKAGFEALTGPTADDGGRAHGE